METMNALVFQVTSLQRSLVDTMELMISRSVFKSVFDAINEKLNKDSSSLPKFNDVKYGI